MSLEFRENLTSFYLFTKFNLNGFFNLTFDLNFGEYYNLHNALEKQLNHNYKISQFMVKKSWIQKFNVDRKPEVKKLEKAFSDMPKNASMLIATPPIIANYLKQVPEGTTVDIKTIRKDLALEYHAEYTCPVTTGIFLRIVAEAAFEELQSGKDIDEITPFWRAIIPNSSTAKKLTFGQEFLLTMRGLEGI
jgi:hypothetical protein